MIFYTFFKCIFIVNRTVPLTIKLNLRLQNHSKIGWISEWQKISLSLSLSLSSLGRLLVWTNSMGLNGEHNEESG